MQRPISILLIALAAPAVPAIDGFSVSTHWEGGNNVLSMGFGAIVRHDIAGDSVVAHTTLYDGSARWPVINQEGTKVAFIESDAKAIALVDRDGGSIMQLAGNLLDAEGYLDWPDGDWVYYSRGGTNSFGSEEIWRVTTDAERIERVATFYRQGCDCRVGQWDWSISADATRAAIRSADGRLCEGTGYVLHVSLPTVFPGDIELSCSNGYQSCGNAISPSGDKVISFAELNWDHNHFVIRDFATQSILDQFTVDDISLWAGKDMGLSASHTRWSANSEQWVCVMAMNHLVGEPKANQVLVNWEKKKAIAVTYNMRMADGEEMWNDGPGDLWVDYKAACKAVPRRGGRAAPGARTLLVMRSANAQPPLADSGIGIESFDLKGRRLGVACTNGPAADGVVVLRPAAQAQGSAGDSLPRIRK